MPGLVATQQPAEKLGGYDFYHKVLGSPKYVVAPMVDQSELAWRTLSRRYGAQLAYTPMINAKMFADGSRTNFREKNFNTVLGEEGSPQDRPLIVQLCGNDPQKMLTTAKCLEAHCDAIDINLGCPQDVARRGHYGSYLQDEWDLVHELINTLHRNLSVPVTAKFRVFSTVEKTVEYAQMLERAGAQILTCHGRTREQRGQKAGLADWEKIRAVKEAVKVPVFANGNVLFYSDIARCLAATGADAVMSAEGNLYNPALFCPAPALPSCSSDVAAPASDAATTLPVSTSEGILQGLSGLHPPHAELAREYLDIVKSQKTPTSPSAVKGHLFKLMRPALGRETDLRERLGKAHIVASEGAKAWIPYEEIVEEMRVRMERDAKVAEGKSLEELITIEPSTGLPVLPHWLAQPYFRPLPSPTPTQKGTSASAKTELVPPAERAEPVEFPEDTESAQAALDCPQSDSPPCKRIAEADELADEAAKRVKTT
ncbi:Dus-domain-containing protein [Obba rivulosa]|uniref:tRNA-dihydrouridine(16/17) synthase [NAD(P)(+)] n=1 Tax=Obba rivulosa TaxID=1052685 RepID=A0A8E2AJZ2_9APHY|nr:Dus-domain-containing protein [Obba rivulosa]